MKVFCNTAFNGHWPVGTSAIIIAEDKTQAVKLLDRALINCGLSQKVYKKDMVELDITKPQVEILQDGNY